MVRFISYSLPGVGLSPHHGFTTRTMGQEEGGRRGKCARVQKFNARVLG
ncbi:hypothetical protein SO694_0033500 [Aureococcus anophagefferens]|uniref:Uncharacterized protein n=1 Tax=Aureococcus anophagefferens TaxID=44056 RepID=A0ABR1FT16_AURAN